MSKKAKDTAKARVKKPATAKEAHDAKKQYLRERVGDGFSNFVTRLGVNPNQNNSISEGFYELNLLTRNRMQLEAMYRGSWIVGAMVDAIAEDMTRAGIEISSSDGAKRIEDFQSGLSRLQIWNSLCDVKKWARLYGGSIGVMQIEGQDLSTPLRIETIGKGQFTGISVYDRWQLYPDLVNVIPDGPEIGMPAFYMILTSQDVIQNKIKPEQMASPTNSFGGVNSIGIRVHHSRVIRQIGVKLPYWQAITEMNWGMSEIERINDRLISFDTATLSSANLINHAHLRTVKVDNLREILSSGGKAQEGLIAMFEYMRLVQSNEGITLLDGEDDYASNSYTFSGLSDMMLQFGQQLSGASGIPLVRLFGQSPAGLSSTGESDMRNYYDKINSQQEASFRLPLTKIIKVLWKSMFGEEVPNDLQFTFKSLWQMSSDQKAIVGRTKAETIAGAYEAGLVSRQVAIKELRQSSAETGLFSNITDEDIAEAEEDEVPGFNPELPGVSPEATKATDSLMKKLANRLKKK